MHWKYLEFKVIGIVGVTYEKNLGALSLLLLYQPPDIRDNPAYVVAAVKVMTGF